MNAHRPFPAPIAAAAQAAESGYDQNEAAEAPASDLRERRGSRPGPWTELGLVAWILRAQQAPPARLCYARPHPSHLAEILVILDILKVYSG